MKTLVIEYKHEIKVPDDWEVVKVDDDDDDITPCGIMAKDKDGNQVPIDIILDCITWKKHVTDIIDGWESDDNVPCEISNYIGCADTMNEKITLDGEVCTHRGS